MYHFGIIPLRVLLYGLAVLGGSMIVGGNLHRRKYEAYSEAHPTATPPEIEAALLEEGIEENLRRLFERNKGRTHSACGFRYHWFRDHKGRARYTTYIHGPDRFHVREWCRQPPQLFKV